MPVQIRLASGNVHALLCLWTSHMESVSSDTVLMLTSSSDVDKALVSVGITQPNALLALLQTYMKFVDCLIYR